MVNKKRRCLLIAVAAVAAAGAVTIALVSYLRQPASSPVAQDVVDRLLEDPPVPSGSNLLRYGSGAVSFGTRGDTCVIFDRSFVLDVSNLKPNEVFDVAHFYKMYLHRELPVFLEGGQWDTVPWQWETRGLKMTGRQDQQWFEEEVGENWTWRRCERIYTSRAWAEVYCEVSDFDEFNVETKSAKRFPVKELADPVHGKRVVLVHLSVACSGVRGAGEVSPR